MLAPPFVLAGIPGGFEVWVILIVILLLFGNRIPGVARSLGQGISSFKKGLSDPESTDDEAKTDANTDAKEA